MKRFVEYEVWDYMDPSPSFKVNVFEGTDAENLKANVDTFIANMKEMWVSGTTKLVRIMDWLEALNWCLENKDTLVVDAESVYQDCYGMTFEEACHQSDEIDNHENL